MSNEELVQAIKRIHTLARSGNLEEAYVAYRDLFSSPTFMAYRPEDQRQALRLMIHAKGVASHPTPAMIEAHRSAIAPLTELVSVHREPSDHEMLGMCHVLLGNEESAAAIYRAGLTIERERSPQSDLCGAFMKRISAL
jgi:hypothetical protein